MLATNTITSYVYESGSLTCADCSWKRFRRVLKNGLVYNFLRISINGKVCGSTVLIDKCCVFYLIKFKVRNKSLRISEYCSIWMCYNINLYDYTSVYLLTWGKWSLLTTLRQRKIEENPEVHCEVEAIFWFFLPNNRKIFISEDVAFGLLRPVSEILPCHLENSNYYEV